MPLSPYGSVNTANMLGVDYSHLERALMGCQTVTGRDIYLRNEEQVYNDEGITRQYIMTKKAYDRYQALIKNERAKNAEVEKIKQEMEELKASRVMYKEVTDRNVYTTSAMWGSHSNYGSTPPVTRIEVSPKEEIAMFIDAKREAETALAKEREINRGLVNKYRDLKLSLLNMSKREMWKYVQGEL